MVEVLLPHIERRAGRNRVRTMYLAQSMGTGGRKPLRAFGIHHSKHVRTFSEEFLELRRRDVAWTPEVGLTRAELNDFAPAFEHSDMEEAKAAIA
jgi:hypothetical protein